MSFNKQILQALRNENPFQSLYNLMVNLRKKGIEKQSLINELSTLRSEVTDTQEDVILEVLDCLTDFCSKHMEID